MLTVVTRIGSDTTTGRMWPTAHEPLNASTTYAWCTSSASDVPLTERYQFLGDPRHNPYLDLCAQGTTFPHGYNWWFDDMMCRDGITLVDGANVWSCLDRYRLADGFGPGVVEDVPRLFQVWREALQAAQAVFVSPAGPLGGTALLGGEIAVSSPDLAGVVTQPIQVDGSWFGTSAKSRSTRSPREPRRAATSSSRS